MCKEEGIEKLVKEMLAGNRRVLAKLISTVEDDAKKRKEVLNFVYPHTGKAYVIGITGSPGCGKSTLVDKMTEELRKKKKKVGIIAVDPTSPFTGGALLGDRIRMQERSADKEVFIRSIASRGSLGGLSRATFDIISLLDAFGKDFVIVETVGAGQAEVDIVNAAQSSVVVLTPGMGDEIQILKAGVMEIADMFVVNKADREGADRAVLDLEMMLNLSNKGKEGENGKWIPPILKTIGSEGKGIEELLETIEKHGEYLKNAKEEKKEKIKKRIIGIIKEEITEYAVKKAKESGEFDDILDMVLRKEMDPYSAAEKISASPRHIK